MLDQITPLILTLTPLLIVYLNFKYGHSQALDLGDSVPREVRDRDYFYLWSFSAWSVTAPVRTGAAPATWVRISAVPPASLRIRSTAKAEAVRTPAGSTPRSKR